MLATLALAGTAHAESISYVEGGNVFLAPSDGSRRVQITTQGTTDAPYTLAGTADDGRTVASFGPSSSKTFFFFNPDGSAGSDGPNLVPMQQCEIPSVGPLAPRLNPAGDYVTYTYFCNNGSFEGYRIDNMLTAVNPAVYTAGTNTPEIGQDFFQPSWFGNRIVALQGSNIQLQAEANAPYQMTFDNWIIPDPGETLHRAEVSRAGGRAIVEFTKDGVRQVTIGTYQLPPPQDFTMACILAANGNASEGTLSPDGNRIAWVDSSGLNVGQVDLAQPGCLVPGSAKVLAAGGSQPRFSAFTLPAPPPPDGGGGGTTDPGGGGTGGGTTTPPPGGGTVTQTFLTAAAPAAAKLAALLKGLVVKFEVKEAGTVTSDLLMPRAQAKKLGVAANVKIGSGRRVMTAAGKSSLKLKLTRKARRNARRLKGKRATLRTTFRPKSGAPAVVRSKKIRIR